MAPSSPGPGLAKTRCLPLLRRRVVRLWESSDYRWRELFEAADVVSEGATRQEPDGVNYYGSTSVILPCVSSGGIVPDEHGQRLVRALNADPHARLRAVRIAYLEAQLRAKQPIGKLSAELRVQLDARGIRIDVEVEAPVLAEVRARRQ